MKSISGLLIPRKKKRRRKRGRRGLGIFVKRAEPKFKYSKRLRKLKKYGTNDLFVNHTVSLSSIAQTNSETEARKCTSFSFPFES